MSLSDRLLAHFQKSRDPLYLQALSKTLPHRQSSAALAALQSREDDPKVTKGVCLLLSLHITQPATKPTLTPDQDSEVREALLEAHHNYHPAFRQVLVKAAQAVLPSLPAFSPSRFQHPSLSYDTE